MPMPPAQMTQPCPQLPQPDSNNLNDLLMNHVEVAGLYHLCKQRHDSLSHYYKFMIKR